MPKVRALHLFAILLLVGCHYGSHPECWDAAVAPGQSWTHIADALDVPPSLDHIQVSLQDIAPPPIPSNPESREIWELSLSEAMGIALENSEVVRALGSPQVSELVRALIGAQAIATAQTIYTPAIFETQVEAALAAFDTSLEASIFWEQDDRPRESFQGVFLSPGKFDIAAFTSSLTKRLATGGVARIGFNTDYLFVPAFAVFDPGIGGFVLRRSPAQYTPSVEFSLRQPLLRGAGVDVNRAPIVIARLQSDQSFWEFKQAVLSLVRSVEEAYWNLDAAHVALRSIEEVLPLASEAVRIQQRRLEAQVGIPADVGQAQTQFAEFRQQRTVALEDVLEREAILRNLLGLPPSDGRRIVPVDSPLEAPISIDWSGTVATALRYQPSVVRQRLAVRVRELQLLMARNQLLPQLDVEGLWRISGLGRELDEAIDLLTDNRFTDWSLGVSMQFPLGNRLAASELQAAKLRLQNSHAFLRESAHALAHELSGIIRHLDSVYQQYEAGQERLQSSRQWMEGSRIRFENPLAAGQDRDALLLALDVYLRALQAWSSASTDTSNLIAQYNIALARLEETKGTLLSSNNIVLQEDPCPSARLRYIHLAPDLGLQPMLPREAGPPGYSQEQAPSASAAADQEEKPASGKPPTS